MKKKFVLIFLIAVCIIMPSYIYGKSLFDLSFQVGIGGFINSPNFLCFAENVRMARAIHNNEPYSNIGMSDMQTMEFNSIQRSMRNAILVANVFGAMEYGIKFRLLYHVLMAEGDFSLLVFDGSFNSRTDLVLSADAGIRFPHRIMPYFIFGPNMTFSFYPEHFKNMEDWKSSQGAYNQFMFRVGIHAKIGLDFKFKRFSFGFYYQYMIKDFDEFAGFCYAQRYIKDYTCAALSVFAYQSRVGASFVVYLPESVHQKKRKN